MPQNDLRSELDRLKKIRKGFLKNLSSDRPATERAIRSARAKLPLPIPNGWLDMLRICDGFALDDISISGVADTPGCHEVHEEQVRENNPKVKAGLLYVGAQMSGDYLALDTTAVTRNGECPVLLISHEPETSVPICKQWPTIAAFLNVMVTAEEECQKEREQKADRKKARLKSGS